jgi:TolB-like protein/DNA-binding winged helix-turn-helix (wHTH) protein/Tfp pilus assembly protein PilF
VLDRVRKPLLRFGIFETDLEAEELRKRGLRVRLPQQAFKVLQVLIENPGKVIGRDELQRLLWPADTFVEFDHGLNNSISRLRDILDDSSTSPRFIETIPRKGYRFIAPVETVGPRDAPVVDAAPPPSAVRPSAVNRRWILAGAAALLAVLVVGLGYWLRVGRAPVSKSLAVLPLTYKGAPDHAAETYLADGMTDALIAELSKLGGLRVTSETSSRQYKGTTKSLPDVARELGVDTVVEGSVFREGNAIRVTVQLIRADTDTHVWAQTYTRGLGSMLALQSEVALAIAQEIGAQITPQEQTRMAAAPAVDPEAYRLDVLGRQLLHKETEPELYGALDHFQRALEIEPKYARAYWGIAETWISLANSSYVLPREGFPKAKAAAERALAIDPSFAGAHAALGMVFEGYDWNFEAAERSYQQALSLSPNDAVAHDRYGLHLDRTGRGPEGRHHAQLAYELNPLTPENSIGLGRRLLEQGKRAEGVAAMRRATELDPTYFEAWVHLGIGYLQAGQPEEAVAAAKRGVELSRGGPHAVQLLAAIYSNVGRPADAGALLDTLERSTQRNPYSLAATRLKLGHADKALRLLLTACEERSPDMAFFQFVQKNRQFDLIRNDARFVELLKCTPTRQ